MKAALILLALAAGLPAAATHAQQAPAEGAAATPALVEPKPLLPVPGTRVAIAPPPGFAPSDRFPGFHRPDAGASIVVNEAAAPVEAISAGMTEQALAAQGMQLLSSSRAVAGGVVGTLLSVREQVRGIDYRKWMSVFGDQRSTVIISASFPEALAGELALPLKNALLTSGWDPRAAVSLQAGLPFTMAQTQGLEVLRRVGNMLVLGDPARGPGPSPLDPLMVVGEAVAEQDTGDIAAFSRARLEQFDRVRELREVQGSRVKVDGREAFEVTATGEDLYGHGPMLVYQLVVPDGRRYTLVQALVGADEEALYLPRFRQAARGLRFVR